MHRLMLQATCSQDADESLCKELTHNFIWVKKQNKTPKSKQTYRECYYRCLIKSSGCFPWRMLLTSGGKKTKNPKHSQSSCAIRSLIHESWFTCRGVVDLIHVFFLSFLPQSSSPTLPGCSFHICCPHGCDWDRAPLLVPTGESQGGEFVLQSYSSPWALETRYA